MNVIICYSGQSVMGYYLICEIWVLLSNFNDLLLFIDSVLDICFLMVVLAMQEYMKLISSLINLI